MGIFDLFKKQPSREEVIKELTDPSRKITRALWRFMGSNTPVWKDDNTEEYVTYGYNYNYLVYAIISWKAQKAAQVPFKAYRMRGGKKEYIDDHWSLELFERPNQWQGRTEFFEQFYGFKSIDGNSYIYTPKIENGINRGRVPEMHVLPAPITEIVTGDNYNPIGGYRIEYSGNVNDFAADEVIHSRYANYDFRYQSYIYGISPLQAAWRNVQKSNSNIEAAKKSFDNMGALGLLYQKDKEVAQLIDENTRKRTQNKLDKKIRGTDNAGRVLWSNGDYGYINFGADPVDLALIEDEKLTLRQLCAVFKVQPELFGDVEGSTFNNLKEARKISYVDGIIPDVQNFADEFNRHILSPLGDVRIEPALDKVPELQADKKEMADWLSRAPWLTENEKREMMGMGPVDGLDVNLYPSSYLPASFLVSDISNIDKALDVYKIDREEIDERYDEYKRTVNMSASELERWSETECSKLASQDLSPIRRNLELLRTNKSDWTEKHYRWAGQTISFVSRMRGNERGEPAREGCPSKRDISLKNWAFDPS